VVHVKDNHDKCNREIEDLESQNERLEKENKKLRMELESLRKKLQDTEGNDRFEQDYKKELARLKNKCTEYETIK
jgi:regulator of replication initiation timing